MNELLTEAVETSEADERLALCAVVDDDETRATIERIAADLGIDRLRFERGTIRRAIDLLAAERSPQVLIVSLGNPELPLSAVEELAEVCEPGTQVIVIGKSDEVGLFRELLRLGVADYFVEPVPAPVLRRTLDELFEGRQPVRRTSRLGRILSVIGVRGGVGATMVACGLGHLIAERRRRRVALWDLDLGFGTVALAFDIDPAHALREAFEDPDQIDSLFIDRAGANCGDTLRVFAAEEPLDGLSFAPTVSLEGFADELRRRFHYTLLDVPRLPFDTLNRAVELSDTILLVADPSLAAMRDTLRLLQYLPSVNGSAQLVVVLNRVGQYRKAELQLHEFEKGIGRSVDQTIPFDPAVPAAMNVGQLDYANRGAVGRALEELMGRIVGGRSEHGLLRRLLAKLR